MLFLLSFAASFLTVAAAWRGLSWSALALVGGVVLAGLGDFYDDGTSRLPSLSLALQMLMPVAACVVEVLHHLAVRR